ncbi:MAG: adenylyltransferase/cytidyltransferase family protein [Prevotellaceae bacterium]|jgi:rfaE bifunctional protein nucleotidyltransferase chain/domain|nr:adenylyltransferase/cytidyltransferase family protein [Prevotellaceae bacterium]
MTQFDLLIETIFPDHKSEELAKKLALWRFKSYKVVFTHGYFDVMHKGHIEYLAKAAELGDVLIVGIYTDSSVRQLKGGEKPIQDEYSRATVLSSVQFVKGVVFFENDPTKLIETVKPDVLVAGYDPKALPGYDFVTQNGGSIITIKTFNGKDTPGIIASHN